MPADRCLSLQESYAAKALAILQSGVSSANKSNALGQAMGTPPPDFIGDQEFSKRTNDRLRSRVPAADLGVLTDCRKLSRSALRLAQAGSFSESQKTLTVAQRMAEQIQAAETRLVFDSLWFAAVAYLSYKMGNCGDANQKLCSSMFCDGQLENQFDYALFHLHRIHLVANAIKIEVKRNDLTAACVIAGDLLAYLAGTSSSLNFPGSWGWQHLSLPAGNFRVNFATATGELAHLLAAVETQTARKLFALSTGFMTGQLTANHVDDTAMIWFRAKKHALDGEVEEFLVQAQKLLATAPYYLNAKLWCATAFDVLSLCDSRDTEITEPLRGVLQYFGKWSFMTDGVKGFLSKRYVQLGILSQTASSVRPGEPVN